MDHRRRVMHGDDGPVEIDEIGRTVTKFYVHPDHDAAVRRAEREAAHAGRLRAALPRDSGLSCPAVLAVEPTYPPRVVMQLCPGEPLSRLLRTIGKGNTRTLEIADKIHAGLVIYTRVFGEPYHDLCFQNLLYDTASRTLTLLDFGIPPRMYRQRLGSPLERSLGNLVGWACYDLVRPGCLFLPKEGYLEVLRNVLTAFDGQVSRRRVCAVAHGAFSRLTGSGGVMRQHYYRTFGRVITGRYLNRLRLSPAFSGLNGISGRT